MQIKIKTLTGKNTELNIEPSNTILQIKQALQEKEGIPVDQIRLIFSGKQLMDEVTLETAKIQPGSTIHMTLNLRGGF